MAVHNDAPFLRAALESLFQQTFSDFELLICDDASSDGSAEILAAIRDPRVRLFRNEKNRGLAGSLARLLPEARGELIARMDADDLCEPARFAQQTAFLRDHPQVGLCGSAVRVIDAAGHVVDRWAKPRSDLEIRWMALLENPFIHPTTMFRAELFRKSNLTYDATYLAAQDYELWTRALPLVRTANLAAPLVRYRLRAGITRSARPEQLVNHDRIAWRTIKQTFPEFSVELADVTLARRAFMGGDATPMSREECRRAVDVYDRLFAAFACQHRQDPDWSRLRRFVCRKYLACGLRHFRQQDHWRILRRALSCTLVAPAILLAIMGENLRATRSRP